VKAYILCVAVVIAGLAEVPAIAAGAATLTVLHDINQTGDYISIPVAFQEANDEAVAAMQFDVAYDAEYFAVYIVQSGQVVVNSGKEIIYNEIGTGEIRILVTGFNQAEIVSGELAQVVLYPITDVPQVGSIAITSVLMSDPYGNQVPTAWDLPEDSSEGINREDARQATVEEKSIFEPELKEQPKSDVESEDIFLDFIADLLTGVNNNSSISNAIHGDRKQPKQKRNSTLPRSPGKPEIAGAYTTEVTADARAKSATTRPVRPSQSTKSRNASGRNKPTTQKTFSAGEVAIQEHKYPARIANDISTESDAKNPNELSRFAKLSSKHLSFSRNDRTAQPHTVNSLTNKDEQSPPMHLNFDTFLMLFSSAVLIVSAFALARGVMFH
jgi:hypothetical protein